MMQPDSKRRSPASCTHAHQHRLNSLSRHSDFSWLNMTKTCSAVVVMLFLAFCIEPAMAQTQDAHSEAEAARLMLENQAILEVTALRCKTRFPDAVTAIDTWLGAWRAQQAPLVAAAEQINAKSTDPSLAAMRRDRADAQIAPVFGGKASTAQLQVFCEGLFAPGTQDSLRASQPETVRYLTEAHARMVRNGELPN